MIITEIPTDHPIPARKQNIVFIKEKKKKEKRKNLPFRRFGYSNGPLTKNERKQKQI